MRAKKTTTRILTSGQVARICRVSTRTAVKWIDSKKLKGYRIPGSRDRRVALDDLAKFIKQHGMPAEFLDGVT